MTTNQRPGYGKTLFVLVFYLILPFTILNLILIVYPELSKDRITQMITWVLIAGPLLAILTYLSQRYHPGSTRRYLLNLSCALTTLLWLYGLLGGRLTMTNYWQDYPFNITYTNFIILILITAALNIAYYTLEWRAHTPPVPRPQRPGRRLHPV